MYVTAKRILKRSYFWRTIGFVELAELYASRVLRTLAMGMTGGFIGVFIYQEGYNLLFISLFFAIYFLARTVSTYPTALIVARFGPKTGTMISNLLFIPGMASLALLPHWGIWALIANIVLNAPSRQLYEISYLVNFSKVKHIDNAGKEIGVMEIVDRLTSALSPLAGGLLAFIFGPQAMLIVASVILAIAAGPLFYTGEPVKTNQKITLRGLNIKKVWRNFISTIALGIDFNISGVQWFLFIFIVILGGGSNQALYAEIGALGSVSILSGLVAAHVFGRVIDKKRGSDLLHFSVIGNAILHLVRPLLGTPLSVVAMNVSNEAAATGYRMPYLKGVFDTADRLPGYRIVYTSLIAASQALGDMIAMLVLAGTVYLLGEAEGLKASYLILGPLTLLISAHGFAIYRKRRQIFKLARA